MKLSRFIVPILSICVSSACSQSDNSSESFKAYKGFEVVANNSITWPEILNQEEKSYIIFFYSETCAYCHEMQQEVIDFAITCPLKTYFLNTSDNTVPIKEDKVINVKNYEEASITGTPTILEVKEATITDNIAGIDDCLTYLNEQRLKQN
jgi:thioredoxin-related protein